MEHSREVSRLCPGGTILLADRPSPGRAVVGGTNASPIRPITGRRSLPPSSSTRRPLGVSYEHAVPPSGVWGRRAAGLQSFLLMSEQGGGGASGPVVQHPWQRNAEASAPDHVPFWSEPVSSSGSTSITALAQHFSWFSPHALPF
jgi:hypothetical protein